MSIFKFKYFDIIQKDSAMKIGTDSLILGAFINCDDKQKALDIGCGTGVLSLIASQKNNDLRIDAIEIDELAFEEAKQNFENSPFPNEVNLIHGDFLQIDLKKQTYDLIFSNPPFYVNGYFSGNEQRDKARHDSSLPLEKLISKSCELLTENGDFWMILPNEVFDSLKDYIFSQKLFINQEVFIYGVEQKLVRKIVSLSKTDKSYQQQSFTIRNSDGKYTEEYIQFTKELHFNKL